MPAFLLPLAALTLVAVTILKNSFPTTQSPYRRQVDNIISDSQADLIAPAQVLTAIPTPVTGQQLQTYVIKNYEGQQVTVTESDVTDLLWVDGKNYKILKNDVDKYKQWANDITAKKKVDKDNPERLNDGYAKANAEYEQKTKEEYQKLKEYYDNMAASIREETRRIQEGSKPLPSSTTYIPTDYSNISEEYKKQLGKINENFRQTINNVPDLERPDKGVEYHCYSSWEEYWQFYPESKPAPVPVPGISTSGTPPCEYFQNGEPLPKQ